MRPIATLAALLLMAAPAFASPLSFVGDVTYRERIALPPGATLRLQLVDLSLPAAPPRIEVAAPIGEGEVPLNFTLNIDDTLFVAGTRFGLLAGITVDGMLLFRNFAPYPIDPTSATTPIHIVTALVRDTAPSAPPSDAPPVSSDLLDSTWTVTAIAGVPVLPRTRPTLSIASDLRAGGSGGCNSWFAEARIEGDTLRFGSLTSTQKGCLQSINLQEDAFHRALAATASWRVEDNRLSLFAADGKTLLSLER